MGGGGGGGCLLPHEAEITSILLSKWEAIHKRSIETYRAGTAMAMPHLRELELVNMQKWVWLLSLRAHSMAVPLPNCMLATVLL